MARISAQQQRPKPLTAPPSTNLTPKPKQLAPPNNLAPNTIWPPNQPNPPNNQTPTLKQTTHPHQSDFIVRVVRGPVVLVGNSIGGFISASVAADYPDLVAGLCLVNSAGGARGG